MFKKNDPLIDSVKAVMKINDSERLAEAAVNKEFGVTSKNALPHELHSKYDQRLAEAKKCMYEGGIPETPSEKRLARKHGDPNLITYGDVVTAKIESGKKSSKKELEEKWKEELEEDKDYKMVNPGLEKKAKEKEKKLEERHMTSSDKEEETRLKKKYDPSGMKAAMKKRYGEKKGRNIYFAKIRKEAMKEDIDSITEEIRNNLQEKLVAIHESGDEAAFEAFVISLSEEQLAILGLNEAMTPSVAAKPQQNPSSVPSILSTGAGRTTTSLGSSSSAPSTGGSVATGAPTGGGILADAGRTSVSKGTASSVASTGGSTATGAPTGGGISGLRQDQGRAAARPVNVSQGGTVAKSPAPTPIAAKKPTSGAGAWSTSTKVAPSGPNKMTPPMGLGMGSNRPRPSAFSTDARTDFMNNFMREETEVPAIIKESFESFLRNKFRKS